MGNERKIRNLIEQDKIDVSLQDIIFKATNLTPLLANLEYGKKKTHIVEAKKQARELRLLVKEFEKRLKDEVYPEVMQEKLRNKDKYTGDANRFKTEE